MEERSIDYRQRGIDRWFGLIQFLLSVAAIMVGLFGVVFPIIITVYQTRQQRRFRKEIESEVEETRETAAAIHDLFERARHDHDQIKTREQESRELLNSLHHDSRSPELQPDSKQETDGSTEAYHPAPAETADDQRNTLLEHLVSKGEHALNNNAPDQALPIWQILVEEIPDHAYPLRRLGAAHNALAKSSNSREHIEKAEQCYRHAASLDPSSNTYNDWANVLGDLGETLAGAGEFDTADDCFREAEQIFKSLIQEDGSNEIFVRNLAVTYVQHASSLGDHWPTDKTIEILDNAIRTIEQADELEHDPQWLHQKLSWAYDEKSKTYRESEQLEQAQEELATAYDHLGKLEATSAPPQMVTRLRRLLLLNNALLEYDRGNSARAKALHERATNLAIPEG